MRTRAIGVVATAMLLALPASAAARTLVVEPGESIQAAVDAARSGDTVSILPGLYREAGRNCPGSSRKCAVVVSKDRIALVAAGGDDPVILEARPGQAEGIFVGRTGTENCLRDDERRIDGSLVKGLTVRGFADVGVLHICVDNFRVTGVRAVDNDEYGVFPVFSGHGRVDHSFARGANDTGIYIGQSHDVLIDHNTAKKNVSGFEIENSRRVLATENTATGNTAGFLSFALPHLVVGNNHNNTIRDNDAHDNNKPNTCEDREDIVCNVPPGVGILLVSTDRNLVTGNEVTGNNTTGIALTSYCIINGSFATNCEPGFDASPDANRIVENRALGNGRHPAPRYAPVASDLTWDGTGKGNCWAENVFGKSFPAKLPVCAEG